ncbi:hypothetical protein ACV1DW_17580 [Aeromonas hydrophila]
MSFSNIKDDFFRAVNERYISNKLLFSTLITIFVLNGKGILYFVFSDAKSKLEIIKGFNYDASFILGDVVHALLLSVIFIFLSPIISGILDKYIFNFSENYRRNVERDFKKDQIKKDGDVVELELENTREHKEKVVNYKLQCAKEEYDRLASEKQALENNKLALEVNIDKLKGQITTLVIENEHNRKVCELSKRSAKYFIDSAYESARVLLMRNYESESSREKFFQELSDTVSKMKELSVELSEDRSFEPKTIEFIMGVHPPKSSSD